MDNEIFKVSIIPHTGEETILLKKKCGDTVNLECDVIGKYVEKLLRLPKKEESKKTSISDIASTAGISKAMVFHYFGTKKELYLYLVNTCVDSISTEVVEKFDDSITDLFDRILHTSKLELALMEKHPNIPSFIQSAYFEI